MSGGELSMLRNRPPTRPETALRLIDNAGSENTARSPERYMASQETPSGTGLQVDLRPAARRCLICQNEEGNRTLTVRERMFGMQESFPYLHCGACGVLQLAEVPADLSRYYPAEGYYSVNRRPGLLKRWATLTRDGAYTRRSMFGRWLQRQFPNTALDATLRAAARPDTRILDVGCGGGDLLHSLARLGFKHLHGVDPLLDESTISDDGVHLMAGELNGVEGQYDLIMFHHSLEHMAEQVSVLEHARARLAAGGVIVVRIPTCESLAFDAYGAEWFQIDAPRHLFLHTHRSIRRVASRSGLAVEKIYCDSQPMQFWASDMYKDDVTLTSTKMAQYKRRRPAFYRELAAFLNVHLRGDQIVVHLRAS